jgi:N-acetylmuramoyl-L-alanine amidase
MPFSKVNAGVCVRQFLSLRWTGVEDMNIGPRRTACRALRMGAIVVAALTPAAGLGQQAVPPFALAPQKPAQEATGTALNGDSARTKFIIALEKPVEFQVSALTGPNRVLVDLPNVRLQLPPQPGATPVGLVRAFRSGLSSPDNARIVIEVIGPVIVAKSVIEKNRDKTARLVLEIIPAQSSPLAEAASAKRTAMQTNAFGLGAPGLQPPLPKPAVPPQIQALRSSKQVIVIDPGHGGDDTGAEKNGIVEKNVVLAFGLKLRDKLNATGRYKVLMTRERDEFVELHARREFAERHRASLFVAVHADYAQSRARGATIYSLRESIAHALQRSARGEAAGNVLSDKELAAVRRVEGDVGAVKEILADLARLEVERNREHTSVFVKSVITYMGESTSLKDNPDREAAFVVIKSAKVPSILIELGYVTNEEDAELLKSDKWRERVSTSIVTAIDNYFSHQMARTLGSQ